MRNLVELVASDQLSLDAAVAMLLDEGIDVGDYIKNMKTGWNRHKSVRPDLREPFLKALKGNPRVKKGLATGFRARANKGKLAAAGLASPGLLYVAKKARDVLKARNSKMLAKMTPAQRKELAYRKRRGLKKAVIAGAASAGVGKISGEGAVVFKQAKFLEPNPLDYVDFDTAVRTGNRAALRAGLVGAGLGYAKGRLGRVTDKELKKFNYKDSKYKK